MLSMNTNAKHILGCDKGSGNIPAVSIQSTVIS